MRHCGILRLDRAKLKRLIRETGVLRICEKSSVRDCRQRRLVVLGFVLVHVERKRIGNVGELGRLVEFRDVLRGKFVRLVVNHGVRNSSLLFWDGFHISTQILLLYKSTNFLII